MPSVAGLANGLTREGRISAGAASSRKLIGGAAAAAAPHLAESAQVQESSAGWERPRRRPRIHVLQPRRSSVHRGAGRSYGPGRRAHAQRHRHRHQHLHRSRARRRLGQGRPALHARAVEAGRAEPGLSTAADARAALSRRHRGHQRALPQDLRQDRSIGSTSSNGRKCCSALPAGKITLRKRAARARVLGPRSIRP